MNLKPAAPVLAGAFVLLALGVLIARTDPSPAPEPSPAAVELCICTDTPFATSA